MYWSILCNHFFGSNCDIFGKILTLCDVVGLQTGDAGLVGQNSSAHVARIVGLKLTLLQ